MKQKFTLVCDDAIIANDTGNVYVLGLFSGLTSNQVPFVRPRITVLTSFEDGDGKLKLQVVIRKAGDLSPEGTINQMVGEIEFGSKGRAGFIATFSNTRFPEFGKYEAAVFVNGQEQPQLDSFWVEKE